MKVISSIYLKHNYLFTIHNLPFTTIFFCNFVKKYYSFEEVSMTANIEMIQKNVCDYRQKLRLARRYWSRPMTFVEKFYCPFIWSSKPRNARGKDYADLAPDRVVCRMNLPQWRIQFMRRQKTTAFLPNRALRSSYPGASGAKDDLLGKQENKEVLWFSWKCLGNMVSGFGKAGAGIIHQVCRKLCIPGGMMIGTDSHIRCGRFGNDCHSGRRRWSVDVTAGMPWGAEMAETDRHFILREVSGWTSPKDLS